MRTDDLVLISVDDHIIEPPTLFEGHIPARYRDRAPHVVREDNVDWWIYEGRRAASFALAATVGTPADEWDMDPLNYGQMRAGCWDVHERVKDMNANGMLASANFPNFPQFCGQFFSLTETDRDLSLAVVLAYNDWHIDEWCGSYPGRFMPIAILPLWDPALMAAEVRRVAAKGCHAVTFSENPEKLGYPSFHTDHWDPFFAACSDEATLMCLHIGSSSNINTTAADAPIDVPIVLQPMNLFMAATDLMFSPVLRKFPELKVALSEGGIGWIPYFTQRCDNTVHYHSAWTRQQFPDRPPSTIFREQIMNCFIDDMVGIKMRDLIGVETITIESDYPHSDGTWPHTPELVTKMLDGVPDDEVDLITHRNAMRYFQFDPFSVRPREHCTVGALRAEAADHDISVKSLRGDVKRSSNPADALQKLAASARE